MEKNGFECITCTKKNAFQNLKENISIRFAEKNKIIPNFELKFPKTKFDKQFIKHNLSVLISKNKLHLSFIEPQISFKEVCLGGEKDIEDALHLRNVFKDHLNQDKLDFFIKEFNK